MEPDWREIEARLVADKKYYGDVLESFIKHPIVAVGNRSPEQQRTSLAEIIARLDAALAIAREHLRHA